ncbi:MAG TPA: glycosyltransferase family 4 protein [Candidatus Thermoplasmatota archaeon]|nr:glycosyltransferase family 4 protein [Candidatus Thermoplasmatota archaeon]
MRALLVTPWLPPRGGGLERYAATVAERMARRGHEVTLLGHADAEVDEVHRGVRRVGVVPDVRLSNAPLSRELARRARTLVQAEGHEVVNAHTPVPGAAESAFLAARRERVPFVVTYHAGRLESASPWLAPAAALHRHTFDRVMLSRADGRIAVSDYVAQHVFRGLSGTVVMPGVDVERFTPGGTPVPGRVLFVGPCARAYAWKGLAVLADAVAKVPGATLRVVGEGDLADHYRAKGAEVVGRVDEARLVEEYRAASVVALPSTTPAESFGMVLAEANACGRPVVGTRMGGIPCFVADGENGLLANPGDAGSLADALSRVLEDPALARKLGDAGRRKVLRGHRWDDVAARTVDALQDACARRRAARSRGAAKVTRA